MVATFARRNKIRLTDGFDDIRLRRARVARVAAETGFLGSDVRPKLSAGDRVAVVATGFAVRARAVRDGMAALVTAGYDVVPAAHLFERDGYLAGTDAQRAGDLNTALRDRSIRAVWFARGGYGTARLLAHVDWDALRASDKLLVGYSDLTALYAPVVSARRVRCLYGPVVSEMGNPAAYHAPSLHALLRGEDWSLPLRAAQIVRAGRARGPLVGGNLTVLVHQLGTPYAAKLAGGILFLEDIGEEAYRLDRLLTQLASSGALREIAGVALGHFGVPRRARAFPPDRKLHEVLFERFAALRVPVVRGIPCGHRPGKRTLPLGAQVRLDTRAGVLELAP